MSSGFVSGGTIDKPTERDDEWRAAQAELEAKRLEREDRDRQHDGKSLYEVLQANKAAKQEAFEEAARLKNQFRGLNDEEADFLDSALEAARKKEADVRKDTRERLEAFRKLQEEVERKALEGEDGKASEGGKAEESQQWVGNAGRKRRKGPELLKGVKLRRVGTGPEEEKKGVEGKDVGEERKTAVSEEKSAVSESKSASLPGTSASKVPPVKASSAAPPSKPSGLVSLGLGYASSDEDD